MSASPLDGSDQRKPSGPPRTMTTAALAKADESRVVKSSPTSRRLSTATNVPAGASPNASALTPAGPADAVATTAPPPSPSARAAAVSSKDYKTMAKRAAALAKQDRLAGGNKSVFDANMSDIGALGIGMQLYFMLTKYLGIVFLIMGIVSLPALVVNCFGHGVTSKMADPLQLAYASLGNQGVAEEIKADERLCLPQGDIDCTWETVKTPFASNPVTVSWIITSSDAIYSFVFLLFVLGFRRSAKRAIAKHEQENLTPAKYAVFVRGLPHDATSKEILDHFNERFDPTQEEMYFPLWLGCCWGRRRKVKNSLSKGAVNCNVVANVEHLDGQEGGDMYLGTWVAEVSVARPTGGLLRTFLSMEALTGKVAETNQLIAILERDKREAATLATQAAALTGREAKMMKKQAHRAFRQADERLLQTAKATLASLNAKLQKKTGKIKAFKQRQRDQTKGQTTPNLAKQSAQTKLRAAGVSAFDLEACEAAFVVFNNLESRRRCLRDYRRSMQRLPYRFQPKALRFREKFPLRVIAAPEPSNILWENLEVTNRGRFYRRSLTNLITFLLLLFSCAIISGAQSAQQQFKAKMPPAGLCDSALPAVFFGSTSFNKGSNAKLDWNLAWASNVTCSPGASGETRYHIAYTNGIVNPLSTAHRASTADEYERCIDPCVSDASSTTCGTLPCFDADRSNAGNDCETYLASHVLYCLCTSELQRSIAVNGYVDGPQALWNDVEPCRGFIKDYLTKNALIVLASGVVVLVNLLLNAILHALAGFERHSSESSRASALALKMFLAQFLNTAVIVLIVNAALHLDSIPVAKDLFKGKYRDFERDWYPTVGMAITMTMLFNSVLPHLVLSVQMFVLAPLKRCITKRSIRTQEQMNKLYAGPPFDLAVRYPLVLNSVLVTMVFAGGSPVLLFIASLTCGGTFWLEKLSILRLYSVKTAYDEALGKLALSLLPWALVLHLGFSAWMYGNPDLMKTVSLNGPTFVDDMLSQLREQSSRIDKWSKYGITVKLVRANVMVMVLFCAITVSGILLSALWLKVLRPVWQKTVGVVLSVFCGCLCDVCCCICCCRRRKRERVQPTTAGGGPPTTKGGGSTHSAKVGPDTAPAGATAANSKATKDGSPRAAATTDSKQAKASPEPRPAATARRPAPQRPEVVLPEFTGEFRQSVSRRFRPDRQLGFAIDRDSGELVRRWQEETVSHGYVRSAGERMLTWEALQAPVKTYAIEANAKYRIAFAELVAAAKRSRPASDQLTKVDVLTLDANVETGGKSKSKSR